MLSPTCKSIWNPRPPNPPHHPSLTASARLLYIKMATLSQQFLGAGWIRANEYALWEALHSDLHEFGFGCLTTRDIKVLRRLSQRANGWIWTGPEGEFVPHLVSFEEWAEIYRNRPLAESPDVEVPSLLGRAKKRSD